MAGKSLSAEFVCNVLKEQQLIDEAVVKEIMLHEQAYRALIQKQETASSAGALTGVDIIVAMGLHVSKKPEQLLSEEVMMRALATHWRLPFLRINAARLDPVMVRSHLPEAIALKFLSIPIALADNALTIAIVNPLDVEALEAIKKAATLKIHLAISIKADIQKAIEKCYGASAPLPAEEEEATNDMSRKFDDFFTLSADAYTDQHIVDAVNLIVHYAIEQHTSEIQLKPHPDYSMILFRIDGILYDVKRIPLELHENMLGRLKTLAGLKTSDRQLAQEGRSQFKFHDRLFRLWISTIPVAFGEKIVIRILDPLQLFRHIHDLGLSAHETEQYVRLIAGSHGLIVVAGPIGSGKTTTVYSTLKYLSEKGANITTIEDPIDMMYEEFNQLIVLPSIGITFEVAMRYVVQQAPAALMVATLPNREAIEQTLQAARHGHLVFTVFPAADALTTLLHLLHAGIAPELWETSLTAIIAQRLLRKVCDQCAQSYQPSPQEITALQLSERDTQTLTLRKGSGCMACRGTGYWGQTAIFEIMEISDDLKALIHQHAAPHRLVQAAISGGMRPFRVSALEKMNAGVTTPEEVLRVTGGLQESIPHTFKSKISLNPIDQPTDAGFFPNA